MPRQSPSPISDDHGWLITPRALTSVATIVGLVYSLHAPVRYVLHVGATVDALTTRVATLETELAQQRGTIAAAELAMLGRPREPLNSAPAPAQKSPRSAPSVPAPARARP